MNTIGNEVSGARIIPISKGMQDYGRHWTQMVAPDAEQLIQLAQHYQLSEDFFLDVLDPNERSSLHHEGDLSFLILRAPLVSQQSDGRESYETVPLGVLLLSTELVTITWQELPVVDQVLQHLQKQTGDPRLRWLIAEIFQSLAQHFLRVLKQINRDIRAIEMELRESQSNEDFFRMLTLQKALTLFSSALRGNITTAQKVLQLPQMQIDEADAEEIADAIVDLQQAREMTDLYGSTITNLMDAYIGVLQNNISNTLKIVTGWTVIIAIPMTVATIYGMNVPLPMQTWHYATPVLLGSAFLLAGLAFAFFHRNDWI